MSAEVTDGVLSYQYLQEPSVPLTFYFGHKNKNGVLVQLTPYSTCIQAMKDESGNPYTYQIPLPEAPLGATEGILYFWNADTLTPLDDSLEFSPVINAGGTSATPQMIKTSGTQPISYDEKNGTISYAEEGKTMMTKRSVAEDATIIYNGVPVTSEGSVGTKLAGYIELVSQMGYGDVTLLDTDDDVAFEMIHIEMPVTAVVEKVTAQGRILFKSNVKAPYVDEGGDVGFSNVQLISDEEDPDLIFHLTKNGKAIDYTDLTEWDVLSIYWNGTSNIYDVRVITESDYVDGDDNRSFCYGRSCTP